MSQADEYRRLSLWHDTVPGPLEPAASLDGDTAADVAIVGAGLTGLWTAYYLSKADPALRIVLCEREIAGFGASGRNGGWCSALFPAPLPKLERMAGRESAIAMYRAMQQTVDEVGKVSAAEVLPTRFSMLAKPPVRVAVWVAKLTVTAPPPSAE